MDNALQRPSKSTVLIATYLAALLVPLLSLPLYHDDNVRLDEAFIGLAAQGRHFTELYYAMFSGFSLPIDIYPFNLILVGAALLLTLTRLARELSSGGSPWVSSAGAIAVVASPFLLENFSYHIDIVGMLAAFVLGVWAAMVDRDDQRHSLAISIALAIAGSMFYQTSANILCASIAILFMRHVAVGTPTAKLISWLKTKLAVAFVALVWTLLSNKLPWLQAYVAQQSKLISLNRDGMTDFLANVGRVNQIVFESLNRPQILVLSLLLLLGAFGTVRLALIKAGQGNLVLSLGAALSLPATIALVYLPSALFTDPIIFPRILMSFGFVLCLAVVANLDTKLKNAAAALVLMFAAMTAATSSAYVASSMANREHSATVYQTVFNDIRYGLGEDQSFTLSTAGRPAEAPAWSTNMQVFPVLRYLVQSYYGSYQARAFVRHLGLPMSFKRRFEDTGFQVVLEREGYSIERNEAGEYLVRF
jgi:hypothetical protein